MTIHDILGDYFITGTNQDDTSNSYRGTLKLSIDSDKRVLANWIINNHQTQIGSGFLKNNILEINFEYEDDDHTTHKGVVVYKCLTKDLLEGFWSEEYGNPKYLGSERCFRIDRQKELLD